MGDVDDPLVNDAVASLLSPEYLASHRGDEIRMCWGGLMQGSSSQCASGFQPRAGTLMSKCCSACSSNGIAMPTERVRALPPELHERFENGSRRGLWSHTDSGLEFRVVNQAVRACEFLESEW